MCNALIDAIGFQNYKQQVLHIATTNIALYTADGTILKRLGVEAMFRSDSVATEKICLLHTCFHMFPMHKPAIVLSQALERHRPLQR